MDGIIILNKPKGFTSNDVVNKVKHTFDCKVGHTGTLDPNATGVLPLLLGNGTKFSKYLINHDKRYRATIKLGDKTSTGDSEGEIIESKAVDNFTTDFIENVLKQFLGKQIQTPPIYSAIKVKGKKLYEYARKGIDVEIPKRNIEIYKIQLVKYQEADKTIIFDVECSKGTYIRSLCEDIAEKLGTVGYMIELERQKVGEFSIENSVTIEDIIKNKDDERWVKNSIITLEELLKNYPQVTIDEENIEKFLNGVKINVNVPDGIYRALYKNIFIGSGIVNNNKIKRDVIVRMDIK